MMMMMRTKRTHVINALRNAQTLQPILPSETIFALVDSCYKGVWVTFTRPAYPTMKDAKFITAELVNIRKGQPTLRSMTHMSFSLTRPQTRYPSTQLELYGLNRALQAIDKYGVGFQLHVISDNIGATAFKTIRLGNARQSRLLA
jgi:hypothetical protein